MTYRILFSNTGYAKGIDGTLRQHVTRIGRHFYCDVPAQMKVLSQLKDLIRAENPDLCCFVEIDEGSPHTGGYNQVKALIDDDYAFHDISSKYGTDKYISRMPLHKGKSNCFVSKAEVPFERIYFRHGTKRLIYRLQLPHDIHLFFAHFSLQKKVRQKQFVEMQELIKKTGGNTIVLADFNIMQGFSELTGFLKEADLLILNEEDEHTFLFHRRKLTLDLCLASSRIVPYLSLRIVPQPFSDHEALILDIQPVPAGSQGELN